MKTLTAAPLALALMAVPATAAPQPPATAAQQPAAAAQQIVAGRVLLKLKAGVTLPEVAARQQIALERIRASLFGWQLVALEGALTEQDTAARIRDLALDPGVIHAQADRIYRPLAAPNDPAYGDMWHLELIGAEAAWDISTGLSSQRVGVVDTGTLRQHEELAAKDVTGWDFISDTWQGNDGDGRDADYTDTGDGANCGQFETPDSWHGSHVAGTILAETNNGLGIAGINHQAGLVTARALGRCGGSLSDIMEGAAWLAGFDVDGVPNVGDDAVSVINLSLGGFGPCSWYEQQIIDAIDEAGVVIVAASGNDGGEVNSPANCADVITVAAAGPGGALANYSSFDTSVELVAPGGQIWQQQSQGVLSLSGPGNSDYQWNQGTSMAAPHVTGAISLLQAINPDATRFQLLEVLEVSGDACIGCQGKPLMRLDLAAAFLATGELPEPPPDDMFAGNDGPGTAANLACNQTLDLIMVPGNEDWFRLSAEEGLILTATTETDGEFDLDLFMHQPIPGASEVEEIGRSAGPSGNERAVALAPGGDVLVQIISYDGAAGGYSLGVTCEDLDDDLEPNNSIDTATDLSCFFEADLFMAPGDRDWFRLDVEPGEPFDLEVIAEQPDTVDLDLYITTGTTFDDVVAESTSPTGQERVEFTAEEGGTWAVVLPFRDASGPYHLNLLCPNREPPVIEPPVEDPVEDPAEQMPEQPTPPDVEVEQVDLLGGCSHTGADDSAPVALALVLPLAFALRRRSGAGDTSQPR
jgi:serine protease